MSENAPGQLLGFTIQYPRALCHLLKATPGCSVCIEVHGDVTTLYPDGKIHAEEDKSSIHSNPVTDKSTDLWKTLSNWVDSVISGELDPSKTIFMLYRNKSGNTGFAEAFDQAESKEHAEFALNQAQQKLIDIKESHAIWPYYKNTVLDNREILIDVIKNFQLESGSGAGYEDVEEGVRGKHVPPSQIRFLVANLSGWLQRLVSEKISANQDAKITWEEFDTEFRTLFDRARRRELIDFTLQFPPSTDEVDYQIATKPIYLRQVDLINASDDEIIEAVTDYLKAKINRDRWIEEDVIDEQLAADFEDKLQRYWKNARTRIDITNKSISKEERGKLLLSECMTKSETIRGEPPPASTIAGTYHALADQPSIGWHSDWEKAFKK